MKRLFPFLAATLALAACSPSVPVKAVLVDGRVTFTGADPDGRRVPCPGSLAILAENGAPVWRIDQDGRHEGPGCAFRFPVTYGQPPAGFTASAAAASLEPGRLYVIAGDGGLYGAFSLRGSGAGAAIDNVDAGSARAQEIRRRYQAQGVTAPVRPG